MLDIEEDVAQLKAWLKDNVGRDLHEAQSQPNGFIMANPARGVPPWELIERTSYGTHGQEGVQSFGFARRHLDNLISWM